MRVQDAHLLATWQLYSHTPLEGSGFHTNTLVRGMCQKPAAVRLFPPWRVTCNSEPSLPAAMQRTQPLASSVRPPLAWAQPRAASAPQPQQRKAAPRWPQHQRPQPARRQALRQQIVKGRQVRVIDRRRDWRYRLGSWVGQAPGALAATVFALTARQCRRHPAGGRCGSAQHQSVKPPGPPHAPANAAPSFQTRNSGDSSSSASASAGSCCSRAARAGSGKADSRFPNSWERAGAFSSHQTGALGRLRPSPILHMRTTTTPTYRP
jgi:hypothetical protein